MNNQKREQLTQFLQQLTQAQAYQKDSTSNAGVFNTSSFDGFINDTSDVV